MPNGKCISIDTSGGLQYIRVGTSTPAEVYAQRLIQERTVIKILMHRYCGTTNMGVGKQSLGAVVEAIVGITQNLGGT